MKLVKRTMRLDDFLLLFSSKLYDSQNKPFLSAKITDLVFFTSFVLLVIRAAGENILRDIKERGWAKPA